MSLKIDASRSATAYHIDDGAVVFPYAIDAHQAATNHPLEWKMDPWTDEEREAVQAAGAEPDSDEADQALIDAHNKAVAEAQARIDARRAKEAEETSDEAQAAADEALVNSPPPSPEPTRRPNPKKLVAKRKAAATKSAPSKSMPEVSPVTEK